MGCNTLQASPAKMPVSTPPAAPTPIQAARLTESYLSW